MQTTGTLSVAENSFAGRRWTIESKLDLPLWVKLQHAESGQFFNILMTLEGPVTPETIDALESAGVELSDFHRQTPSSPLPGKVSRDALLTDVLTLQNIKHVEGVLSA